VKKSNTSYRGGDINLREYHKTKINNNQLNSSRVNYFFLLPVNTGLEFPRRRVFSTNEVHIDMNSSTN